MQNIEEIVAEENQAKENLLKAQEAYKMASLNVRKKLGAIFTSKRESLGFNMSFCSGLLGVFYQKVFSIENPEKVPNPFGVDTYLEMLRAIDDLSKIAHTLPKVRKGRLIRGK